MKTWIREKVDNLSIHKISILDYKNNYKVVVPECLSKDYDFYSRNTRDNQWFGAFINDTNVAVMFIGKSNYEPNKLHLYEIETLPDWQGKGIASKMISWLENYAMKNGFGGITLRAFEPGLISYYKRFGFKQYSNKNNIEYMSLDL